jgi:hypothetical protein
VIDPLGRVWAQVPLLAEGLALWDVDAASAQLDDAV